MEVIHYLNYTAQVFSACADAITTKSTESASILRAMCSARMFHVSNIYSVMYEVKNGKMSRWDFTTFCDNMPFGHDADAAIKALRSAIDTEYMLYNSEFTTVWYTQDHVFNNVKNHSIICVNMLKNILERVDSDIQSKYWICQNCLCHTDSKTDCVVCGMKENWMKPLERF